MHGRKIFATHCLFDLANYTRHSVSSLHNQTYYLKVKVNNINYSYLILYSLACTYESVGSLQNGPIKDTSNIIKSQIMLVRLLLLTLCVCFECCLCIKILKTPKFLDGQTPASSFATIKNPSTASTSKISLCLWAALSSLDLNA